jgi:hypothetical protein
VLVELILIGIAAAGWYKAGYWKTRYEDRYLPPGRGD